ncbi:MAG: hypothetical protein HY258_12045 [Chloroflexi bacterium]|nr:hypothetical protein [Chloroflexota bacterium]
MTLDVRIPDQLAARLEKQARAEGKEPETLVVEIVEQKLAQTEEEHQTERFRQHIQALYEAGVLVELSDKLKARIIPGVTHEEVRAILSRAGGKPLSEIIGEQRGPKD